MNDSYPLVKFGAFAVICVIFAASIVVLIGNIQFGVDREEMTAVFSDASGLLPNDAVKISGVVVGKVGSVDVVDGRSALVRFNVDKDVRLGSDTRVSIKWRDAIGLRFLYLEPAGEGSLEGGHEFPLAQTDEPANIGLFLDGLTPIMNALDPDVSNQVIEAFAEALVGREQDVKDLVRDGAQLTNQIATRDDELRRLLTNSADILDAYAAQEENLDGLLDSFADVATVLAGRTDEVVRAVTTLDDAQDELADLLARNDVELRNLLDSLDRATSVLSVNRDRLDRTLATFSTGFGTYHRISNIGQFFNVRGVGFSSNGTTIPNSSYRGAELPPDRTAGGAQQSSSGLTGIFGGASALAQGGSN